MKNLLLAIVLFGGSFILLVFLSQNVSPVSSLFPVERLYESLTLLTKRNPQTKISYYKYLTQRRLSDIEYIVKTQHTDILVSVSLRYSTTVGKTVAVASVYNVQKSELKLELERQKKKLQNLVMHYESHDNRQRYIEDDINYITSYEKEL